MFCADYVTAFVYHMLMTGGAVWLCQQKTKDDIPDNNNKLKFNDSIFSIAVQSLGLSQTPRNERSSNQVVDKKLSMFYPFLTGSLAGLAASVTLYPLDFVRSGVVEPGLKRVLSAGSTVPYAATLFGVYFGCRDPKSTSSQFKWAMAASTGAVLAEMPLDYAKRNMIGSTRVMLGIGLLYVPFAGFMLVMYDKALLKILHPFTKDNA